jgi:hypothetical protein
VPEGRAWEETLEIALAEKEVKSIFTDHVLHTLDFYGWDAPMPLETYMRVHYEELSNNTQRLFYVLAPRLDFRKESMEGLIKIGIAGANSSHGKAIGRLRQYLIAYGTQEAPDRLYLVYASCSFCSAVLAGISCCRGAAQNLCVRFHLRRSLFTRGADAVDAPATGPYARAAAVLNRVDDRDCSRRAHRDEHGDGAEVHHCLIPGVRRRHVFDHLAAHLKNVHTGHCP